MGLINRLFSLEGKKAVVTGGSSGIGFMIASALVEAGATVIIASRKEDECIKAADLMNAESYSGKAIGLHGDVSTENGVNELTKKIGKHFETLDILINNAGTTWGTPYGEFPHSAWSKILDVNVTGLFMLTQALTPMLEASASSDDPSRIINLGSIMGSNPYGDGAYSYSASKAAVHQLTRILAKELANRNITINSFAPGPFQSKMTAFAIKGDENAKRVAKSVPLGRIGNADDIAAASLFLCGKGGSYITGAILPIDGGMHVSTGPELFSQD